MLKLISIILLLTTTAHAQVSDRLDRAPFALQNSNYNCEALIDSIKSVKDFRYAWLYNTFDNVSDGANLKCVEKLNKLKQTTMMQVHLINEPCHRNKNCGQYEFLYDITVSDYQKRLIEKDLTLLTKLDAYISLSAKRILPTLSDSIQCYVSPGLESNLNQLAANTLIEITKKHYGKRCQVAWNPVNNNKFSEPIEGTIHELHGSKQTLKAPCIANLDGEDIEFLDRKSYINGDKLAEDKTKDYLKKYQHCKAAFLWIAEDNCIHKGATLDPRDRTNCTDKKLQNELKRIGYN